MSESGPVNRKQRRAAARNDKSSHLNQDVPEIKMAMPDRSGPKGKTLLELAQERQAELSKGTPFEKQGSTIIEGEEVEWNSDDEFGPAGEAMLWSFSLSMVHLMLDVLANNQYRQEIVWSEIATRFGMALPMLWFTVYLFHTKTAAKFGIAKQLLFLVTAVAAGCYMVRSANKKGYYAVMKRAPPLGTLWIWAVVELDLIPAVLSVMAVGGYTWWNGFVAF